MKKVKLNLDFDALFPGQIYKIQNQEINIQPVNVTQIAYIIKKFKSIIPILKKENITFDNYNKPDNIITIINIIFENIPEILSELTGIELESIKKLPLDIIVDIFNVAMEVNIESKDSLEKNFRNLTQKMQNLIPKE